MPTSAPRTITRRPRRARGGEPPVESLTLRAAFTGGAMILGGARRAALLARAVAAATTRPFRRPGHGGEQHRSSGAAES